MDGCQNMILRCFKHHQAPPQQQTKPGQKKESEDSSGPFVEDDDDLDILKSITVSSCCPLTLSLRTTEEGYWQLQTNQYPKAHQPPLQALTASSKKPNKSIKASCTSEFESILNQQAPSNILKTSALELFEEEFRCQAANLHSLNTKLKRNQSALNFTSSLFMEDLS